MEQTPRGVCKVVGEAAHHDDVLLASEERLAAVIGTAMDAILTATEDQRIVSCNPAALEMFGYEESEVVGKPLEVLMPERFRPNHGRHVERFGRSGETRRTKESFGVLTARRQDGTEFPIEASVSRFQDTSGRTLFAAFVRDISERFKAEIALRESEQRFRALVDAASQIVWTNSSEGRMEGEQPGWASFTGQSVSQYQGFGWADAVHPDDQEPTVEEWNRCVRDQVPFVWEHRLRRHDGVYRTFSVRGVPVKDSNSTFREWVGMHTDVTEQRQNEAALREALTRESARAEREALVNQIGDGIRQSLPPEEIEALAVSALGKALAVDRCYIFTADTRRDALVIAHEWYAEGVSPVAGEYCLSELGIDVEAVFGSGETLVIGHLQDSQDWISDANAGANQRLQISSLVNVPFYEKGRFVGALAVAMATGAREWTGEEVALIETLAGQLHSTIEAVRLQQRERNIAQQLQDALQPSPPQSLPGLALEGFYKPALEEAGVGGDFFDVFPVEKGCTALVVGDLSGKGLAAASEVATVRNMVRYALYSARTIAESVTGLNNILVEHRLLAGFATLFIGVYDQNERTLTYVNCGQEPGLLWRASREEVEPLPPTGPVLGGFDSPDGYREATILLAPGDVLALFTDGMTEVGSNRRALLEIEGLTTLFAQCCAAASVCSRSASEAAAVVKDELVGGVEAHTGGAAGRRDDIALLIGVARQEQDGE